MTSKMAKSTEFVGLLEVCEHFLGGICGGVGISK